MQNLNKVGSFTGLYSVRVGKMRTRIDITAYPFLSQFFSPKLTLEIKGSPDSTYSITSKMTFTGNHPQDKALQYIKAASALNALSFEYTSLFEDLKVASDAACAFKDCLEKGDYSRFSVLSALLPSPMVEIENSNELLIDSIFGSPAMIEVFRNVENINQNLFSDAMIEVFRNVENINQNLFSESKGEFDDNVLGIMYLIGKTDIVKHFESPEMKGCGYGVKELFVAWLMVEKSCKIREIPYDDMEAMSLVFSEFLSIYSK